MGGASYAKDGAVAVITLENPPVNGLGLELRTGIVAGLEAAAADAGVQAVVLVGAGKGFSGGADLRELDTPRATAEPTLAAVIRAVEASAKPVVAAIHGTALGGGLELALACHHRIAVADARLGLPEVKLGILPGGGGTQRLPRAVGLEAALDMIVSGAPVTAERLRETALLDAVVEEDVRTAAIAFAAGVVAEGRPSRLLRDVAVEHDDAEAVLARARGVAEREGRGLPAARACVEAVAAAVAKPFEEGLRVERELFLRLVRTPEAKALRHAFLAQRAAARLPGLREDAPTRPVRSAAVVGAGTMGSGIAICLADAGIPVTLVEVEARALERGMARIRETYEASVKKGKLAPAHRDERVSLVRPVLTYAEAGAADVVVEAVFEDMAVKRDVFAALDEVMKPGAILATNTSTLDVNRIAAFTHRPQDVIGMHFFSPANVMRLLEVVRGAFTGEDVLATVMALAKRLDKAGVVSGVCDGFIGNRMLEPYRRQAVLLLEEGALPPQIDEALQRWGMAMGPFRVSDVVGNDVSWLIRKRRYAERPGTPRQRIPDRLCELGRFGQKVGAGWYRYQPGERRPIPDPAVEEIVVGASSELGLTRRRISDDEIVERCVYALVNEGARILEEGIAQRASDLDVVYLAGYGFPAHRGGPMFHASAVGLSEVVRAMERFASNPHADPAFWRPAPLLTRLAADGRSF